MEIGVSEHGLVRVFKVDLPPSDVEAFRARLPGGNGEDNWPLREALGARHLDENFIELFDVSDLEDIGLRGYMAEGLGVAADDLVEDAQRLDGLSGHVLVVLSRAFGGQSQTLAPRAPLRWIGTWREDRSPVVYAPLPGKGAQGNLAGSTPQTPVNPHLNVLWAILALPVLLLVLGVLAFLLWR